MIFCYQFGARSIKFPWHAVVLSNGSRRLVPGGQGIRWMIGFFVYFFMNSLYSKFLVPFKQ